MWALTFDDGYDGHEVVAVSRSPDALKQIASERHSNLTWEHPDWSDHEFAYVGGRMPGSYDIIEVKEV